MINEDLIVYIQSQFKKNIPESEIISKLSNAGWIFSDIQEGLSRAKPQVFVEKVKPVETELKTAKIQEEVTTTQVVEPQYLEINGESLKEIQNLKVWTPSVREPVVIQEKIIEDKPIITKPALEFKKTDFSDKENTDDLLPNLIKKDLPEANVSNAKLFSEFKKQENSVLSVVSSPSIKSQESVKISDVKTSIIPNPAVLSSYQRDVDSIKAVQVSSPTNVQRKSKVLIVLFIVVLSLISIYFVLKKFGYFSQPIIPKDPKTQVLSAFSNLEENKSYGVTTKISITMPTVSNITASLVTGEKVASSQKDSIAFELKGKVDKKLIMGSFFDYQASLKSSLLPEDILTQIKFTNNLLYVKVPQLSKIFGINAPKETWVMTEPNKLNTALVLLPTSIQDKIKKIDVYNIASNGLPIYAKEKVATLVKDFVDVSEITLENTENINTTLSYHYRLHPERKNTKDFFTKIVSVFTSSLSPEIQKNVDEGLGATVIDYVDIWVGVDDGKLYQYNFKAKTPLSKIIALDDKVLSSDEVTLEWQTTYSDVDTSVKSNIPTDAVEIEKYIKSVNDLKIKDILDTFKVRAKSFYDKFGNFGRNTNKDGNCAHPTALSLFSPLGHGKNGEIVVGNISLSMNELLAKIPQGSLCYSTGSSWAMSAPYSDGTSYCVDSSGFGNTTSVPLSGVVCKQ